VRAWHGASFLAVCLSLVLGCGGNRKTYRVGILSGIEFFTNTVDGFRAKMSELGYVEGKNIGYDLRSGAGDPGAVRGILDTFVSEKVDLIFVFPTAAALEAKAATRGTTIPVLFAHAVIEGVGLVDSVRAPGGNVAGVRYPGPDLAQRRFEILMELVPEARLVWVFYLRGYPIVASQLDALRPAAQAAGVTIVELPADDAAEVQAILDARAGEAGPDAILNIAEPLSVSPEAFMVFSRYASERGIPVGGGLMQVGPFASLFGVSTDNVDVGRQAALLADRVLRGTPAGTIPVVSAEQYLQINYTRAQQLGREVPEALLAMADEVIR
jgi:putative ABC transport system substrate-binding protein